MTNHVATSNPETRLAALEGKVDAIADELGLNNDPHREPPPHGRVPAQLDKLDTELGLEGDDPVIPQLRRLYTELRTEISSLAGDVGRHAEAIKHLEGARATNDAHVQALEKPSTTNQKPTPTPKTRAAE